MGNSGESLEVILSKCVVLPVSAIFHREFRSFRCGERTHLFRSNTQVGNGYFVDEFRTSLGGFSLAPIMEGHK